MDDMELLHRYASHGDKDAVSCLIRKYQKMVFSACLRRLGCTADAEDATQQVFMAMLRCGGGINSSVSQWLYRCSINVTASMIRSRKNRIHREREKGRQTESFCGNGEAERKETFAILMQCLGKLDTTDQKVLVDNYVNDMTQQAIASSMGVTQQAVAKRLGRVILFLRREMTSKGVIFSLIAAVLLLAKKVASAAPSSPARISSRREIGLFRMLNMIPLCRLPIANCPLQGGAQPRATPIQQCHPQHESACNRQSAMGNRQFT